MRIVVVLLFALVLSACATVFQGSPYVDGGPAGCQAKCRSWGLELVGMVAMGEYSDACVCAVPGRRISMSDIVPSSGGAAGVAMQMQRASQPR